MTASRVSAQDRRVNFMHDAFAPIREYHEAHGTNPPADSTIWLDVAWTISANGRDLGRTARWQEAVAWFDNFSARPVSEREWAVLQGSVWLGYANV